LCTFEVKTVLGRFRRLGAVTDAGVVDLESGAAWWYAREGDPRPREMARVMLPANMLEYLQGGETTREMARQVLAAVQTEVRAGRTLRGPQEESVLFPLADIKLLAPLPQPASLRDFYAFEQHVKAGYARRNMEIPKDWYELPVYYKSGHHNIIGTGEDVHWPSFTQMFDYELELAVVIGKRGRNIPAAEAMNYVAGFTVMNDFSARDIQKREMAVMLGPAKGKDWCTALGPWLVTRDEIGDPYNLKMTARINGEIWSEGHSGTMFHRFEKMIEFLSQDDTLLPGDVLGSGTVGTGCGLELNRWVKRGDVMELEIEKIGVLRNRVV
jgi:2-keto-4-pentenoate hydratase/2-oxohepta-3-ene-1,7-dioic acid hydratase in catechol pathway